jgi:UDP-N-acetylmuramoyl-L-alanyl-D-glutamate--2,6-diaminopimelate ligase
MNRLLNEVAVLETTGDPAAVEVVGIEHDSRKVGPGDLFVCLPGASADGHLFAPEAVDRGAVALVCERLVPVPAGVVQARVARGAARPAMARAAAVLYGRPSRDLTVVGVTGTNGKTTVTHLLASVLTHSGCPATLVGTLSGERTTPESTDLQRILARSRDEQRRDGARRAVVMEVSSHALVQSRVDAVEFDLAIFTNLTHDHLDFHGTMGAYWQAKASLFEPVRTARAVVNADDPWGRRLLEVLAVPAVAVRGTDAERVRLAPGASTFRWRGHDVALALTGRVNVDNALLAAEAAVLLGVDPAIVAEGLARAPVVPGRLELVAPPVGAGEVPTVLVDFAHTPAALEATLGEAAGLTGPAGRVLLVVGCGGDRDRAKRPMMGAVADRLAARTFLTSDNPRHEDAGAIIDEIRAGFAPDAAERGRLVVEPDRRRAIHLAVGAAGAGDVVLVAGKGHETYQQLGDERIPFDDRTVSAEALASRGGD